VQIDRGSGRDPDPDLQASVLAVIPARGGSKGVARKNLQQLDGHPLIAWSIRAALACPLVGRVVCSTDDEEIAATARHYGAQVPGLRPAELAQDDTPDLPVFQYVLGQLLEEERPAVVVHLRPTTPFRPPGLIADGVSLLVGDAMATSVRTVSNAPVTPYKMWRPPDPGEPPYLTPLLEHGTIAEPWNAPRQSLPDVVWHNGLLDVVRTETIESGSMSGDRILPLPVSAEFAIDIDSWADLERARAAVRNLPGVHPARSLPWSDIRLLVLDVDGTLTPGTAYYSASGEELKRFHTHDGRGIEDVRSLSVEVAIVTQEASGFTSARASKLGIREVHLGIGDKLPVVHDLGARLGIPLSAVAYVGDDLGDAGVMRAVRDGGGIACAVADARPEILEIAEYVTKRPGGGGGVRDVCDEIVHGRQRTASDPTSS